MKKTLTFLLVLLMVFSLAACGGKSDGGSGDGAYKDSLVVAISADSTSMDPHVGKETPSVQVTGNIFSTLVTCTPDLEILPCIAESWEQKSETEWEFKIRDDVYFHDGSKMTIDDVKYSLDRAIASPYVSYIVDFISEVNIIDDTTLQIKTYKPYAPTLVQLSLPFAAIVPRALTETDEKLEEFKLHPVGSGPYKFVEWRQGEYVKLEAFEDYFGEPPKTKNITLKIVPEGAQRAIGLETGELDLAYEILTNDFEKVKSNPDLTLYEAPSLTCWYMSMNTEKEPFNDKRVRQAIRYALDEQKIVDTVINGAGVKATSIAPPNAFGYIGDEVAGYDYDPAKAKELLAEAGYPNGFKTELMVNDNQSRIEVCQVIQQMLKEVGIDVSIKVVEFASFFEASNNGEHEMAYYLWTCSAPDVDYQYYSLIHSANRGAGGNRSFFNNPDADALIEKARQTTDLEQRKDYYRQLEEILREESPNAIIYYSTISAASTNKVEGFIMSPAGYHTLATVTVKE